MGAVGRCADMRRNLLLVGLLVCILVAGILGALKVRAASCDVLVRNPCGDLVPACKVRGPYAEGEYDCR